MKPNWLLITPLLWTGAFVATYGFLSLTNYLSGKDRLQMINTHESRRYVANRATSLTHSIGVIAMSTMAVISVDSPYELIANPLNNWFNELALIFTTGYFIYDIFYILLAEPNMPFVIHHSSALLYYIPSYLSGYGGNFINLMIICGELTAPVHVVWEMSKKLGYRRFARQLSPIFTYTFIPMRLVFMPIGMTYYMYWMWYYFDISNQTRSCWFACYFLLNGLGYHWSKLLLRGYRRMLEKERLTRNQIQKPFRTELLEPSTTINEDDFSKEN